MKHETQVEILRELLQQLDEQGTGNEAWAAAID